MEEWRRIEAAIQREFIRQVMFEIVDGDLSPEGAIRTVSYRRQYDMTARQLRNARRAARRAIRPDR